MDSTPKLNWAKGSNNIAPADRLPDGFFRHGLNVDPTDGGKIDLRCGFQRVTTGTSVRAVFGLRKQVVMVDADRLMSFDTTNDSTAQVGTVDGAGAVAGAVLNQQLYLTTPNHSLRYDGHTVKPWAIPEPLFDVAIVEGSMAAGVYKVAVTAVGVDGEESGVVPVIVTLGGNQSLRVSSTDARQLRLYCSSVNGSELYEQGELYGPTLIGKPVDGSATLTTSFMVPMPGCENLAEHHSVLLGAAGQYLYMTEPMRPHLVDIERGFFQYAAQIDLLGSTDGGVYVAAGDETWFLTGVETDSPQQRKVADFGAVNGAYCLLPDGTATWFTRYGQVIGDTTGAIRKLNEGTYAPDTAAIGAAGLLEHNGGQRVVTTMRGPTKANRLAASDFSEVEITDER